jgi:hypothetical protein
MVLSLIVCKVRMRLGTAQCRGIAMLGRLAKRFVNSFRPPLLRLVGEPA